MSYYKILGLEKEPFSTSPDPQFFYQSNCHKSALLRLMIEIRLKRGLSIVLGDVGTGKTTLSRKLLQMLKARHDIIFHMILDPTFEDERLFLMTLTRTFGISIDYTNSNILNYKEALREYLYQKGVEEGKTVVLVIDESQKLNMESIEVLRVMMNYETNEFKLLQLVILSQMELLEKIRTVKNLWDRISLKYVLNPFDLQETREMINFRLSQAGYNASVSIFSDDAVQEIYKSTQGYPRRIAMLCHNCLRQLVVRDKAVVDLEMVHDLIWQEVK